MQRTVEIKRRFCGPPESGNGGYVCGLIGEALEGGATVRLLAPPPLDKRLNLEFGEGKAQLLDGERLVGKGWSDTIEIECPFAPSFDQAVEASRHFSGFEQHPFPCCFVCGPERSVGDGLRIFPGHLPDSAVVAAPWIPDASLGVATGDPARVDRVFVWAALDCTSAFPMLPVGEGRALVLGQMSVQIHADIQVGEKCVMLGWPVSQDGKKYFAGSAVIRQNGSLAAIAKATWIEVPAQDFQ